MHPVGFLLNEADGRARKLGICDSRTSRQIGWAWIQTGKHKRSCKNHSGTHDKRSSIICWSFDRCRVDFHRPTEDQSAGFAGAMPSVETSTTAKMLDASKETHARA